MLPHYNDKIKFEFGSLAPVCSLLSKEEKEEEEKKTMLLTSCWLKKIKNKKICVCVCVSYAAHSLIIKLH